MDDVIRQRIADALGCALAEVHLVERSPLAHQSNRLYDTFIGDRHLIVKEYLKVAEHHDAPVREYRALQLVAPLDIAPRPVLMQPSDGAGSNPIVAYDFLDGRAWGRGAPPDAVGLRRLADLWLMMHTARAPDLWLSRGFEHPLVERAGYFEANFNLYAKWVTTEYPAGREVIALAQDLYRRAYDIARELDTARPPLCFCRADPRLANVIQRLDGRLGMIDWEDCGLRDPARDVADLLTHPEQEDLLTWDDWQAFLVPYLDACSAADPLLSARIELYLALFPLFWLELLLRRGVQLAQRGQLAGWTANAMPSNERLRRYLARALAWPAIDFSPQLAQLAHLEFFPPMDAG